MPRASKSKRSGATRRAPRQARLRGKGDYSADIIGETDLAKRLEKKIDHLEKSLVHVTPSLSKGASLAGRALGSFIGQGDLGALAGEQLSKLLGYGDYRTSIRGNSLMGSTSGTAVPKFQGDGKRGIRLTEREFIGNVLSGSLSSGSSVFTNQSYKLIPTDSATFPWLSKIAGLFDQWEPHGIVFEFHTTSSTFNGTSQALGAVVMATDYDVNDPPYASKQIMENADYACSSVPSASLLHGVECDPKERPLDVMYTTPRVNQLNFSTLGNFQIATQGCSTAGTTLGELWVSYDITFYKKQLVSSAADVPNFSVNGLAIAAGPIFVPSTISSQKDLTYTPVIGVGTDIFFPRSQGTGRYLIVADCANFQAGDGASLNPVLTNAVSVSSSTSVVTVGQPFVTVNLIDITAANASVRFGLKNTVNANTSFAIVEVPPTFYLLNI